MNAFFGEITTDYFIERYDDDDIDKHPTIN